MTMVWDEIAELEQQRIGIHDDAGAGLLEALRGEQARSLDECDRPRRIPRGNADRAVAPGSSLMDRRSQKTTAAAARDGGEEEGGAAVVAYSGSHLYRDPERPFIQPMRLRVRDDRLPEEGPQRQRGRFPFPWRAGRTPLSARRPIVKPLLFHQRR